jgi:antitoxin component YwqK of YwqJK toxin-antitoxin module
MVKTCISIIFSILIVITAGASFGIEPEFTEVEPNNTPAQANEIKLDQTVIGTFHYGDYDAGDYYSLTAPGKCKMTATVVLTNPQCGIRLGAMGFHSDRRDIDWVPSSSSRPAWIISKKGESPVSFSFPVQGGYKGYVVVSGPYHNQGGYSGYNWSLTQCTKGGDYYLLPTANEKPRDLPASKDGKRVLPPLQYRLIVTFAGEGQVADTGKPLIAVQPEQPPIVIPPSSQLAAVKEPVKISEPPPIEVSAKPAPLGEFIKIAERHYPNGQLQSRTSYYEGTRTPGVFCKSDEFLFSLKDEGTVANQFYKVCKHGTQTTWFESGKKQSEGQWVDGQKDGVWTSWCENGRMREQYGTKGTGFEGSRSSWNCATGLMNQHYEYRDGVQTVREEFWGNGQKRSHCEFSSKDKGT